MPTLDERIAPGGRWAYRARAADAVAEVEILRFGAKTPLRVLVRFVDPELEDRREWVPPARLKVPWDERIDFLKREQRWAAARSVTYLRGTPTDWALGAVFAGVPDWTYADPAYNNDTGILSISDLDGLLADLDLEREVVEHPLAFMDGDALVVPWPVTERIVRRLAERNAAVLLPALDAEEREAEQRNRWGYYARETYISAEACSRTDAEFQVARDLVRAWCGQAARDRHDELVALRAEVVRLGHLVETAVEALQAAGARSSAERIERELGVPIEVVRAHRQRHD